MARRALPSLLRVRAKDDAGVPTRIAFRAFAPWRIAGPQAGRGRWGLPEPVLPIVIFVLAVAGVAVLALFAGPAVIAVMLFSPMATTWLGLAIALSIWGMNAWPRHLSRARAAALYRDGVCPTCNYTLNAAQNAQEGALTRCPECGSQWCLTPPTDVKRYRITVQRRGASTEPSGIREEA
jgi:ssDNA-binding Zn-finger/Zn-ribbon topoisomerase 1